MVTTEVILINVSGQDKPGLMAALSCVLADFDAHLVDIGQAVIHEDLALGILVRVSSAHRQALSDAVMATLDEAGSVGRISPVSEANYQAWLEASGKPRYILTLLASGDGSAPLHAVSAATQRFAFNIDTVRRLTDRGGSAASTDARLCVELRLRGRSEGIEDLSAIRSELLAAADRLDFDFSLQEDTVFRRNRRLVAFDMDSTLITAEVMDELAQRYGVGGEVKVITAQAMNGTIDFKESFRQRAKLLRGMPVATLAEVATKVSLNVGAHRLLRALKHFGYRTALISGGFQYVGEHLQKQLGIDYVYANDLVHEDGFMTGEVKGEIVDADRKALVLKDIAAREGIALAQTIAVGDGANDLPMLQAAGLGVAFHAKDVVNESARNKISNFGLDAILYLIGFSDRDIYQALGER